MAQNICSLCCGTGRTPNYAKVVDPPTEKYGTVLGDSPQQGDCKKNRTPNSGCMNPGMCIPVVQNCAPKSTSPSTLIQVPCDQPPQCPKFVCEPCPPPTPTRIWLLKSTPMPQKSFCLPIGESLDPGSSLFGGAKSFIVCCSDHPKIVTDTPKESKKKEVKPVGYISRYKDMDFVGGKFIYGCSCGRKNGLSGDCPRISCRNNPGCNMNPPLCWPQFKEPAPPPPPPPDQKMICVPFEVMFEQPEQKEGKGSNGAKC